MIIVQIKFNLVNVPLLHIKKKVRFSCAEAFEERCQEIETTIKAALPIEIEEMKERLLRLKEENREMLVTLNRALHQGNSLLQVINFKMHFLIILIMNIDKMA